VTSSAKHARRARRLLIATAISALVGVGAGSGPAAASTVSSSTRAVVAAKVRPSIVDIRVHVGNRFASVRGLVLRADGYILVDGGALTGLGANADITVLTADGGAAPARLIGTQAATNLAVLRAEGLDGLTPATFANITTVTPEQARSGFTDGIAVFGPDGAVIGVRIGVRPSAAPDADVIAADDAVQLALELIAAGTRSA
jgi:S1-C subfamily serine protease